MSVIQLKDRFSAGSENCRKHSSFQIDINIKRVRQRKQRGSVRRDGFNVRKENVTDRSRVATNDYFY